jgi:glycosyltransferase involved in cell wall biosynthesis
MSQGNLNQFLTGAVEGDAITGQALIIQQWLREFGLQSQIYAQHIHPSVEKEVRHLSRYRRNKDEKWAIYHHSIGSNLPDYLAKRPLQLMLIYHNITPTTFFERSDPMRTEMAQRGRTQLLDLRDQTALAMADSAYNELDLLEVGYENTVVLPLALNTERYDLPLNEALAAQLQKSGPRMLFVGRLAPNKKQEDLVKLLYYYRRIEPRAHLYLVGDRWEVGYDKWIETLAADLKIDDGVTLTGKVSQQDMITYYKTSDLFVSMSEHEGFGLPLIESMYFSLPLMAYGTTAVPYTLGDAGVQFYRKDYEGLAELIQLLMKNQGLRQRLIAGQKERVQNFLEPAVCAQFERLLHQVGIV